MNYATYDEPPEQVAERRAMWERAREAKASEFDYANDEPPSVPEAKGHLHHRARLINLVALKRAVEDKRDAARETLHRLDNIIGEEVEIQRTLTQVIASETVRLLEGLGFVSEGAHANREAVAREQIEAKLAANRRAAETAKAARPEVERRIALHDRQLEMLAKREQEFLSAALVEMLESSGLPQEYMRRIQSLRDVMQVIFALGDIADAYGWEKIEHQIRLPNPHDSRAPLVKSVPGIKLPRAGVDVLKLVPQERYVIKLDAKNPWRDVAAQLLDDPTKNVTVPALAA
jgi:hypothetical protein